MNQHIRDFYRRNSDDTPSGHFHDVVMLSDHPSLDFAEAQRRWKKLPKGWFELARLSVEDRIEFTRDFWLAKLPYHPSLDEFLTRFFSEMDDIFVAIVQKEIESDFEPHLVYSMKGGVSFFRGAVPASDQEVLELRSHFLDAPLPEDYLSFLQIHNGFWKTTDCTGLVQAENMNRVYEDFQNHLAEMEPLRGRDGSLVAPGSLIPFYESFGMPYFQCFWAEWYPEQEMGNVYYSEDSRVISIGEKNQSSIENMAFTTFTEWLMFYLDQILIGQED